jgi:hypothetical protein
MPPAIMVVRIRVELAELSAVRPISSKSPSFTMPAHAQDAWDKRDAVRHHGAALRAIEIRPATIKGRKIVHHALARRRDDPPTTPPRRTRTTTAASTRVPACSWNGPGKQGEIMRPDTGKLPLPGRSSCGTSTARRRRGNHQQRRARHLPLSEGSGAEYRQVLHLMGTGGIDIPPNTVKGTQGFFFAKQPTRRVSSRTAPAR